MHSRAPLISFPSTAGRAYPWLVIVVGTALLVTLTLQTPNTFHPWISLVICLFVAFQVNYPLDLFGLETSLISITTLGAGLLYGLPTASWAALAGIFSGYGIRVWRSTLAAPGASRGNPSWRQAAYIASRHNLALLLALLLTGEGLGYANLTPHQLAQKNIPTGMAAPLVLFALFHTVLLLMEVGFQHPQAVWQERKDWLSLLVVEFLPLPFILIAVMSYPITNLGALAALGVIPVVVAVLGHEIFSIRARLERRVQELSTLNEISQTLRSTLDLEKLLGAIHFQVSQLLGVDNFYVALYDEKKEEIWYPLAVKKGQREAWAPRPLGNRLTDRVIQGRKPINLYRNEAGALPINELPPSETEPSAWIGVPLISSDRVIGCLALFSLASQARFAQADLDLLVTLSGQISVGIENALLYDQVQHRAVQLENLNRVNTLLAASLDPQEVLAQICRSVSQVSSGKRSAVFMLSQEKNLVWLAYAYELSETFTTQNQSFSIAHDGRTRCLRTRQPVLTSRLENITLDRDYARALIQEKVLAYGDFPLVTPEGQIGFLSVYYDTPHTFSGEEVELLQTFASQAALAVSNARLHAHTDLALSQRVNQLSILEAVGRELSAAMDSERLFEMILNYACEFTASPWACLGLYNPATRQVEIKAAAGYPKEISSFPLELGISGRAIRTRQIINLAEAPKDLDYYDLTQRQARSQLSIPILHEGRVLGVLTLENSQPGAYTPGDQAFISQLVNQAAIAVVNAELYKETQRRLREQSTLYLVSMRLSGALDQEAILQTIRDAMLAAQDKAGIGIYTWNPDQRVYRLERVPEGSRRLPLQKPFEFPASLQEASLESLGEALGNPAPIRLPASPQADLPFPEGTPGSQRLVFPLVANRQRLGMVILILGNQGKLEEDELQLLGAIVAQGSIALQNALLFADAAHGRDRLSAVINSVREGIVMIESGGWITLANESFFTLSNLPPEGITGKRLTDLPVQSLQFFGYSPKEAHDLVNALEQGQRVASPKVTLTLRDPERILERTALPVTGQKGKAIGWLFILRDVTEEHQIAQARELITETLVHDLRSPLTAVLGAIDFIQENAFQEPNEVLRQALPVARRGARRVLGLVETLMEIARMQSGNMDLTLAAVDLSALATTLLADFVPQANEIGVILHQEIPPGIPGVSIDASKISRVISNLVDNALKFTPSGGQVLLAVGPMEERVITVRVSDTGPGVPAEYREKIFERFTQVPGVRGRRRGTGLGLAFCRLAVEAHGGRIWVEPRSGGGSVFAFTLPLTEG